MTLIALPIVVPIAAITLVGLPFAFIALVAWLLVVYFAKIVVGAFVGRMILSSTKHQESDALVLLAGIGAIIVVINLPAIGGFLSFLLTIVGVGMIVQRLFAGLSARAA